MDEATAVPLTEAQSGLWYAQRLDRANPIFNTGQYLDLRGPLDVEALRSAIAQAGVEAESLSLRFIDAAEGPRQIVDPALRPQLQVIDLTQEADPEAAALAAIRHEMDVAVAPETGPMARQLLYRLAPDRHFWAQQVHHFAIDGYGMVLLTGRIAELYGLAIAGKDAGGRTSAGRQLAGRPLAGLVGLWADDATYRASDARADDAAWWRNAMTGMDEVIGMAQGKAQSAYSFRRFEAALPQSAREALLARAKAAGLNWPDALTALVAAYCRRFTGTPEIIVGVPSMGRMSPATARVVAMVMNVLPLRVCPDEDALLSDYLAHVARDTAEARKHGRYRSEYLRRDLGLLGGNRRLHGPLINVQPYDRPPRMAGLEVALHVTGTGPVEDINFTFRGDGLRELSIEVDANPDLYSAEEVAAHGKRLAVFIEAAAQAERLVDVSTATPEEALHELEAYNATAHVLPDVSLTELIERGMAATPDAPALRFDGAELSYAELDRRTAALAVSLQARGVGAEVIVAVALPRSLELVIALVAVLRAGGAYLPLDLEHPTDRIATILDLAKPAVVLARNDPFGLYGDRLLAPDAWPQAGAADGALIPPASDDAAYVIFTSGSTGTPKGVLITHRAIVNRLLWMGEHYGFGSQDRILQKTPATFDVSVWEFFLSFITGGTLVVAPPDAHRDPAAIATLIRQEAITTLHFVPSMLGAFLDSRDSDGIRVARVFCSGEELPADLRDRFHQRVSGELHNLYGPTEAAVDVSFWPASADDTSRPVPIGHAVWNTRLVLLDDQRRPVPTGMAGNLYLGGVQLARGYLGRPDLTAERFIDDPFHPGERLYLAGDLARRRPDGAVVYLGRSDHQVKIRGLRIELGEIEAVIGASGLATANIVLARDGRLVAYVVPADGYSADALRAALGRRLPDYMVPAAIVEMAAMPVTANGKLDRKALPEPVFSSSGGEAPAAGTETRLAAIFAQVLGRNDAISANDDFFGLGGDSLSAVQLLASIREEWGQDPGLAALFEHPDLRGLAAQIDAGAGDDGGDEGLGPLITLVRGDDAVAPLFLVHPAGGLGWGYRTLALAVSQMQGQRRTVYALQSPALDPDVPAPQSIDALAADYARRIMEAWPQGPCHVAGWSVGGIIAQAIAVELEAAGRQVGLVAMLDSYPADCWRAEPEPTTSQALRALLAIAGYDPEKYPHLQTRKDILDFLRAGDSALGNLPPRALDGVIRVVLDTNRLIRGHYHRPFGGVLTHVRAGLDHQARPELTPQLWQAYGGTLDSLVVPFLHPQLTGPDASALIAPALAERMAAHEQVPA